MHIYSPAIVKQEVYNLQRLTILFFFFFFRNEFNILLMLSTFSSMLLIYCVLFLFSLFLELVLLFICSNCEIA